MWLLVGESSGAVGEDVDCNSGILSDFDDLRFTTSDGATLLSYFIDSITGVTPNRLATICIEFDYIGIGETYFYMYYGKASAPAVSSGEDTFIAYDGFERGVNGNAIGGSWTVVQGAVQISTDHAYGGTRCAKWLGGATYPSAKFPVVASPDVAVRFRIWKEDASGLTKEWGNGTKQTYVRIGTDESIMYYDTDFRDTGVDIVPDQWQLFEITEADHVAGTYDIWLNGVKIKDNAAMYAGASYDDFFKLAQINGLGGGIDFYVDDFIVRDYLAVEATWGAWGDEENEPAEGTSLVAWIG